MRLGRGVGLVELVGKVPVWPGDHPAVKGLAAEVEWCVWGGNFRDASRIVYPGYLEAEPNSEARLELDSLREDLVWCDFASRVELAADIDLYLGVLEADRQTFALAKDCRRQLDLLLVLADLCEDLQMSRSAAEARRLHGLACGM